MYSFLKRPTVFTVFLASFFLSGFLRAQTNQAPVITSSPVTQVWNDETYEYIISTFDPDGDPVTIMAPGLPAWLSLQADPGGLVTIFAGSGSQSYADGLGTLAAFSSPGHMTMDGNGNLYVADVGNNQIRKITPSGQVSNFAGSGFNFPRDGIASESAFRELGGIAFDSQGNLLVCDRSSVRMISPEGMVSTLAGSFNRFGFQDGTGSDAIFLDLRGLTIDSHDNVYVVDATNARIRKITQGGVVTTFAGSGTHGSVNGTGTQASFSYINGLAIDKDDNIYVADESNGLLRKISPEAVVTTVAGSGRANDINGTGTLASFFRPQSIVIDNDGNLYVTTAGHKVRKVDKQRVVTTVAGDRAGLINGRGTSARFNSPRGILIDSSGDLLVADRSNHIIRKISGEGYRLSGDPFAQSGIHGVTVTTSDGNGGTATQSFNIIVNDISIPRFVSEPIIQADEEQQYQYLVEAELNGTGGVTLSGSVLPDWLSLESYNQGIVSTIAGLGTLNSQDGTGAGAGFRSPFGICIDADRNLYVVDQFDHRIRKITPDGVVTTIAGSSQGFLDGTGTDAKFSYPRDITIDSSGNLYVTDVSSVRKVSSTGVVTTLVGREFPGFADGTGTGALFKAAAGITIDGQGNLYVADSGNYRVRKISPGAVVTTIAGGNSGFTRNGTGIDARFRSPRGLTIDTSGNLYVTDFSDHLVRKISPNAVVTTFAGSGYAEFKDGLGTEAGFSGPTGLTIDEEGNIFVSDNYNNRIRRISPEGYVSTIAGSGQDAFGDGTGTGASFDEPQGIISDPDGNLYVSDSRRGYIRKITFPLIALSGNPVGRLGNHDVTLVATDDSENRVEQSFTISVEDVMPPVFSSSSQVDFVSERVNTVYVAEATDRNPVEFSLGDQGDESAFSIDASTGRLSFLNPPQFENPTDSDQDNAYEVSIIVSDGENETELILQVNVIQPSAYSNSAPVFGTKPITNVFENQPYQYNVSAYDDDLDPVTITAVDLPSWLSFQKSTEIWVSTFAGSGRLGLRDGQGTEAHILRPSYMAIDDQDNIYVADGNARIRKISPDGLVSTLAGGGTRYGVNTGVGTEVQFLQVTGLTVDKEQNIYAYADYSIKKITPEGVVTDFVGSGFSGYSDGTGTGAAFSSSGDMMFDASDNLYVLDYFNYVIRKVTPEGVVTTFAGSGSRAHANGTGRSASFTSLGGIVADQAGNLLVTDSRRIRKITPEGVVTTFVGSGNYASRDGSGTLAEFKNLEGLIIDSSDRLYVAEENKVRIVSPDGVVTTYVGGKSGYVDGPGHLAQFGSIHDIVMNRSGHLFVTDNTHWRIRKIVENGYQLTGSTLIPIGSHDITLAAIDGNGGVAHQRFTINVTDDGEPAFVSDPVIVAALNEEYRYEVKAIDNSGNPVTVMANELPGWLKLDYSLSALVDTYAGWTGIVTPADGSSDLQSLRAPHGMVMDEEANLYVVASRSQKIIKITPEGLSSDLAGFDSGIYTADFADGGFVDGTGSDARFNHPQDLTIDSKGNLYVADLENFSIRKITQQGVVTTVAGNGTLGYDDGTGSEATFFYISDITIDSEDNLYISQAPGFGSGPDYAIRKITPEGVVSTLARSTTGVAADGPLAEAEFASIFALTTDKEDNIYFVGSDNLLRKISDEGFVSTVIESDSGTPVQFESGGDIHIDANGNIFITEYHNNRVRMLTPEGVVSTVAGNGVRGSVDGSGQEARFAAPQGILVGKSGELFISELGNHLVRKITFPNAVLAGNPGEAVDTYDVELKATSENGSVTVQTFSIITKDLTAPVFTSVIAVDFKEGATGVVYSTLTSDASTVNYSLGTEGDEALFAIDPSSGEVSFLVSPDFENPTDADVDNNYIIEIAASDGLNVSVLLVTITVIDAREGDLEFTSTPTTSINDSDFYHYTITTNEPNQIGLSFQESTLPQWLSLTFEEKNQVTTYAGSSFGYENGSREEAEFGVVTGLAADKFGNVYIAETFSNRIRVISAEGVVSHFVGSGRAGFGDGIGQTAHLNNPWGLAIDDQGNLFVADLMNNRIRKVTPDGIVSTLAGSGQRGFTNGTGTEASFDEPIGIAIDNSGNLYVTERGNNAIRKITAEGVVSTMAGTGASGETDGPGSEASFYLPVDIDVDDEGNVYVFDSNNRKIRKIDAQGIVRTIAGFAFGFEAIDGSGADAAFANPGGLTVGPDGNLYISDQYLIRKVSPEGDVVTIAGSETRGSIDGDLSTATFNLPKGLDFDERGNLFIAEYLGYKVRKISAGGTVLSGSSLGQLGSHDVVLSASDELGSAEQAFTISVAGASPAITDILRQSPATEITHSTSVVFRVIFNTGVSNVDATDFELTSGGVSHDILDVIKVRANIYEVSASGLPLGLVDLSLKPSHDIMNLSGTLLSSLTPTDTEETYVVQNQVPVFKSSPVTQVSEDQLYVYDIELSDSDNDPLLTGSLVLPDWLTIEGDRPGLVTHLAGNGSFGFADGTGQEAIFRGPRGIEIDDDGNLYIADANNHLIRKISTEGVVSVFAGSGSFGSEDGTGVSASFRSPQDLAFDNMGNLIVADYGNSLIRKISPEGVVSTIAGLGTGRDEDGEALSSSFYYPQGIYVSNVGDIYVADTGNDLIRKISTSGIVTTVAGSRNSSFRDGTGTDAWFDDPVGMTMDESGNLFVADARNHSIRKITPEGVVTTFAGNGTPGFMDGTGAVASFSSPYGLFMDKSGNILVADRNNGLIRQITPDRVVTTIAGSGSLEFRLESEDARNASLDYPADLVADEAGNLFVTEAGGHSIKKIAKGDLALKGNPAGRVGDHDITLRFADNFGALVEQSFTLGVIDATAPVFTSSTTAQINENSTSTAYDAEVTDQSSVTFSLGTANDESRFNIEETEGLLVFTEAPDFENPDDADQDNNYIVQVIATDAEGNLASQTVTLTVINIEEIAPVITISSTESSSTNAEPINVTFTLSEEVLGFTVDDLTIVNGLATNFAGSGTTYSVDISPVAEGEVTIDIAAGTMTDLVGNDNDVATQFSIVSDKTTPAVTIDTTEPAVTNAASFPFTFSLSEEVEGFTVEDVNVDKGSLSDFTGSGTLYTATLTPSEDGDISISIADGLMTDLAGNGNEPADPFVITSDRTSPVITISSDVSGTINDVSFDIMLTLSEEVQGFSVDDISIVNGTLSDFAGSGTAYVATVTPLANGQVTVDIATDQMTDLAGNGNIGSNMLSLVFDVIAPAKPVIMGITDDTGSSNSDGVTNDGNIIISGTAEVLSAVEVFSQYGSVRSTQTDANGNWNLNITDITLIELRFDLTAKAVDLAGNQSPASDVFVLTADRTAPAKPVITHITDDTGRSNSDGVTNDANIVISGTAEALSSVEVFTQYGPVRSTQTDANGDWSLDITDISLVELKFNLTAKAVDLAGNQSLVSDVFVLTTDRTAPAKPVITQITDDTGRSNSDGVTNDANIIISGTAEALSSVEVFTQYGPVRSTQTDANGDWSLDITNISLVELKFNLTAKATDLAGNSSPASDVFVLTADRTVPAKPVITSITDDTGSSNSDGVTNDANIIISGTAEALSSVEVFTQYGPVRSTQTDVNGDWSLDITDISLVELKFNLTAKATDLAGNSSPASDVFVLTADRTAPVKPVITSITDDTGSSHSDGITNDANIIISGTAEALSSVEVSTQYGSVRTTQTDANGTWNLDITDIMLLQLTFNLTARAVDLAGNQSLASDVFVLKPDYIAPGVSIDIENNSEAGYIIIALFNEEVSGLTLGEITVTGGTASNLVQLAPSSYSFLVTSEGSTTDVIINANTTEDLAGNGNTASNQLTLGSTSVSASEGFTNLQSQSKTEEISVYPNPANRVLTIDLSAFVGSSVTLSIQDATGRVRLTRAELRNNKVTLDVSSYEEGLFIIQMSDGKRRALKKFMIRR